MTRPAPNNVVRVGRVAISGGSGQNRGATTSLWLEQVRPRRKKLRGEARNGRAISSTTRHQIKGRRKEGLRFL